MLILCLVLTKHLAACSKQEPHRNNKKTTANPCCITDQFTISYGEFRSLSIFPDIVFFFPPNIVKMEFSLLLNSIIKQQKAKYTYFMKIS